MTRSPKTSRAAFLRCLCALLLALPAGACVSKAHREAPRAAAGARTADGAQAPVVFRMREWGSLSDAQKNQILAQVIDRAREQGTFIHLHAAYYVAQLDALRRTYVRTGNESGLDASVGLTFKTIAVMEGDWDNGQGRVEQARALLGPEVFEEFKRLHPDKYRHLIELDRRSGVKKRAD